MASTRGFGLGVVFSRLLQTIKLERDAFVWMDFNDRATGDAALLVAGTQVLMALGSGRSILDLLNPFTLISLLLSGLFFWVVYSGLTYAISKYLLNGHGTFATYLRLTGFAYPTLLLIIFGNFVFDNFALVLLVGAAWFVVIVANGLTYVADIALQKGFLAAIGGYIALVVIQSIVAGIRII
ncbi:MAG: YIP1 family protein [Acidimicrobiia bacterium]